MVSGKNMLTNRCVTRGAVGCSRARWDGGYPGRSVRVPYCVSPPPPHPTPPFGSHAAITKTFQVNTLSHFWLVKAFLPDMVARNHGHIVSICSASAFTGVGATTTTLPCMAGAALGPSAPHVHPPCTCVFLLRWSRVGDYSAAIREAAVHIFARTPLVLPRARGALSLSRNKGATPRTSPSPPRPPPPAPPPHTLPLPRPLAANPTRPTVWQVARLADYAASKWAVFGFHESLRMELKKDGKTGVKTTCVVRAVPCLVV
jgi:NAD(P)-dependent dehydrogenase (short-subunit alcohol dehydrogenase family)